MTRDEVKKLMNRIKNNYPTFVYDDYKLTEWCKELKDYDETDVHNKLEEHMRNENFGRQEPKVYFLTKYLQKVGVKDDTQDMFVYCSLCRKLIRVKGYRKHYDRCSSIEYISKQVLKYKGQVIDKKKYYAMSDESFEQMYNKFLRDIADMTTDEIEKKRILAIMQSIEGKQIKFTDDYL